MRWILERHRRGDPLGARELAHFVPRFYGRSFSEILAMPLSEDEARLVVARHYRRASWSELIARADESGAARKVSVWDERRSRSRQRAKQFRRKTAWRLADVLERHPELLTPSVIDIEWRRHWPRWLSMPSRERGRRPRAE